MVSKFLQFFGINFSGVSRFLDVNAVGYEQFLLVGGELDGRLEGLVGLGTWIELVVVFCAADEAARFEAIFYLPQFIYILHGSFNFRAVRFVCVHLIFEES